MDTTKQHLTAITRFLDRLARRESVLLLANALGLLLSMGILLIVVAALALSAGIQPTRTMWIVGVLGVVGFGVGLATFLRGRWSSARTVAGQARSVEARLPGLRGRLITVIERAGDPGAGSTALIERAASHAHRAVNLLRPTDVHSSASTVRTWLCTGLLIVLVGTVGGVLPVGPMDAVAVLFGKSAAAIRLADADVPPEEDNALVGDITLRYVFPDYTGLEPREVPNSDGTIIAPLGTVVHIRARTAGVFDAAAVQLNGEDPIDAGLTGGRDIAGTLTVEISGTWRVLLFDGGQVRSSTAYELRVEADQPPVVVTSETGTAVAAVDAPLGLGWQVTDDYGIVRVSLEIVRDGETIVHDLREPIEPSTGLNGIQWATPRTLGLQAGDKVEVRVVAIDNDRVEGGNRGESETLILQVMGPRGYGKNLTRYQEKLRDALLDVLADFLEDSAPPADTREGLIRWMYGARKRLDPVRRVMEEQWGDEVSSGIDGDLVQEVMEASGRLFRFTMTTFDRQVQAGGQQPIDEDLDTFFRLHGKTTEQLEIAIFVIDSMLRQVDVGELARQAKVVAEAGRTLAEDAKGADDAALMTTRLDQLERQLGKLRRASAGLQDDSLAGFIDGTIDQSEAMMEAIRSAVGVGQFDQARAMMDHLSEQLDQLSESLSDREQRRQAAEDELGERFAQLMEDLEQLANDQDEAAETLAKAQDEHGVQFSELVEIWEQMEQLAVVFETQSETAISKVGDGRGWRAYTIKRLQDLFHLARGIRDSVAGRDIQGVALRLTEVGVSLPMSQRFVARESTGASTPVGVQTVEKSLIAASGTHAQMLRLLGELAAEPEESSFELLAAAQKIAGVQARLQDRQRTLEEEVAMVEGAIPTATGEAAGTMKKARQAMERARSSLEEGMPMQGEGHQRHASDLVRETQSHLQQASDKQQQMQQMMRQMQGKRSEDGSKTSNTRTDSEIPAPELFKTPEAYREALLEGMSGSVPEEFKALKRRFYEDLVRQ